MNEKVHQLNTFQQIREEFRIIALTALIATAAIWTYISMNLLWMAVVYLGFLIFISLIYGAVDYYSRDVPVNEEAG